MLLKGPVARDLYDESPAACGFQAHVQARYALCWAGRRAVLPSRSRLWAGMVALGTWRCAAPGNGHSKAAQEAMAGAGAR